MPGNGRKEKQMAWNSYPGSALKVTAVWEPTKKKDPTTYALQRELRKVGFYPSSKFLLDGHMGPSTIAELQKYLKKHGRGPGKYTRAIDGDMGRYTLDAMVSFVHADGGNTWGIITNRDISGVGMSVWPNYKNTRAWQEYLNKRR